MELTNIQSLLEIMRRLRDPETGCPWDVEQDFSTIAPYTIEEAYEVADAIERSSMEDLRDELGDLLFQVVFHAQMAEESNEFDFQAVVATVCEKMIRRHPHVFPDADDRLVDIESAERQKQAWEDSKERERAQKGQVSVLDGIPAGLAELQKGVKLQKRAARVGFDWASPEPVIDKIHEELEEVKAEMRGGAAADIEAEIGDLLFAVVNLARQLDLDPGRALRTANAKFERRFRALEDAAGDRESLDSMSLEQMEALWQQVKRDGNMASQEDRVAGNE